MTLHLTIRTPAYILQVSDRRIARSDSGETHPLANKNVVFLARDGIVTIGYTGLGYLDGVPTDTWIACKLAGEDHRSFRDGRGPGMLMRGLPKRPWPDIGQTVELLRRETEVAFGRLRQSQVMRHQIIVAGWQDHRKRIRPVTWLIENYDPEPLAFTKDPEERYVHYDRRKRVGLSVTPDGGLSGGEIERFNLKETLWPPGACTKSLVDIVRYVSAKNDSIGPDCMAILLPNPEAERKCYFRYEPLVEGRAHLAGNWQNPEVPAAFSPWFVGPQLHAPPSILMGSNVRLPLLGDYELVGYAPPIPQAGEPSKGLRFVSGFSTQQRPRQPRRRSK